MPIIRGSHQSTIVGMIARDCGLMRQVSLCTSNSMCSEDRPDQAISLCRETVAYRRPDAKHLIDKPSGSDCADHIVESRKCIWPKCPSLSWNMCASMSLLQCGLALVFLQAVLFSSCRHFASSRSHEYPHKCTTIMVIAPYHFLGIVAKTISPRRLRAASDGGASPNIISPASKPGQAWRSSAVNW